jgi:CRISPR-associated protein (TIGR03986 family)
MTFLTPWPEHQNPTEPERRTASAPYNFVPLPEKIIAVVHDAHELPDHDKYYRERLSGYFDVTLTTRSPLYIRGPLSAEDFSRQEPDRQVKDKPEFFHTCDEHTPVIPGSSLRGMLRALLEIVSYGKMQWVSEKQLFFRTVDKTAVGRYYRARMGDRVETGFLIRRGDTYYIQVCSMARVRRSMLGNSIYSGSHQVPRWQGQPRQYAPVWVRLRARMGAVNKPNIVEELSYQRHDGMVEGRLVITGDVPGKRKEFVFLLPADNAEKIPVSDDIISRFHDDDQLTQWQEEAFPTNQPTPNYRERNGMLGRAPTAPGDPIFFLREKGKLTFIGRARMFRLPYTRSPFDLVNPALRSARHIDYAEALFGFALIQQQREELGKVPKQGDKRRAYAGRVIVTDGVLQSDPANIWLAGNIDGEIVPRILAMPKPTAFQHYLTQQHPDDQGKLDHYDSVPPHSDTTTIRGHKLYWHQGLGTDQGLTFEQIRDAISEEPAQADQADTQHTRFKPLKLGVQFSFRVYFENLSDRELGALCWTLHPHGEQGRRYFHHLGMGKPLGMGAVELHARLHIIDRPLRYEKLFNDSGDSWRLGKASTGEDLAVREVLDRWTQPFEKHLLHELNPDPPCTRLADMLRIAILLKLLEWPGYRAEEGGRPYLANEQHPNTRYMKIQPDNEYRNRLVLPDPRQFDDPYFRHKSRPQVPQAATVEQAPAEEDRSQPALSPELAELFTVGKELSNLVNFTQGEQGVEVRFWNLDPAQIIGFIPGELIDRHLGPKISVVVTGLHQEPSGRIVVELKLRPRR